MAQITPTTAITAVDLFYAGYLIVIGSFRAWIATGREV